MNRNRLIFLLMGLGILAAITLFLVNALPPRTFTILTGSEQGEYYRTAEQYAKIAADKGFAIDIRTTAGSLGVLDALTNGKAHIGFVQGGMATEADSALLSTVASIFR